MIQSILSRRLALNFLLFILWLSNTNLSAADKPNVLFIIADDLTTTALSCYGNEVCKTPNIDRLAAKGMRFTHAYCQAAYCGPSRASFLSGYYPHATGVQGYNSPRAATGERATWPQHFKQAGYYTARVSKIFHMGVPIDIETVVMGPMMRRRGPSVSTVQALNGKPLEWAKHLKEIPTARKASWVEILS